jgi:hypothetical protein
MTDPHICIAGDRCRNTRLVDGQRLPAITEGQHELCDPCHTAYANAIHQLPRDWDNLRDALGERRGGSGVQVRSTPTPAIPINAGAEAVMSSILEVTDRAAAIIAGLINTEPPDARRKIAKRRDPNTGQPVNPENGSLAERIHDTMVEAPDYQRISTNVRLIEASIDLLATSGNHDITIWDNDGIDDHQPLIRDDHGEPQSARGRLFITTTGLDLLNELRDLHQTTRAHLGHTRLRHHYHIPCPSYDRHGNYCGAMTVGRNDGQDWVDCTTCKSQWTEREFDWLKTMIAGDKEIEMLRYLLAEAYWRLDQINDAITNSAGDPALDLPGAGTILHNKISEILTEGTGHPTPDKRKTAA